MSPSAHLPDQRPRPGTVTAGALLTWIGAGFLIVIGLLLAIAGVTRAQPFTRAITEAIDASAGVPGDLTMLTLGLVLLGVAALLALLAVAAFRRSRGGLIALTVAAGLYVVLVVVALDRGYPALALLFGVLWVAATTALFWSRRTWYRRHDPTPSGPGDASSAAPTALGFHETPDPARPGTGRPRNVSTGAAMVWLVGAAGVYSGIWVMWSDFAEYLEPDSTRFLLGLGLHLGVIVAAIGAVLLVLTTVTFRGSRDTLIALTAAAALGLFLLVLPILSAGSPGQTILLKLGVTAWLVAAFCLLWSRAAREWYSGQGR